MSIVGTLGRKRQGKRIVISQSVLEISQRKFAAIAPMLEFRLHLDRGDRPEFHDEQNIFRSMEELSVHLARQNRVSHATIWNWYRQLVTHGYSGLRKLRRDRGQSRFFSKHLIAAALVKEMLMRQRNRAALPIHNELLRSLATPPSYDTTRAFVKHLRLQMGRVGATNKRSEA